MECQIEKNEHFQHVFLFEFNQGVKAAEVARIICAIYRENTISEKTTQRWFSCFKNGHFDMDDATCPGRTPDFNEDNLNALIHDNPHQITQELANEMGCDHLLFRFDFLFIKVKKN